MPTQSKPNRPASDPWSTPASTGSAEGSRLAAAGSQLASAGSSALSSLPKAKPQTGAVKPADAAAAAGPWTDLLPASQEANGTVRAELADRVDSSTANQPANTTTQKRAARTTERQPDAASAAAQAQVTVDAEREYSQLDALSEDVTARATSLESQASSEAERMTQTAQLQPGDPGYDPGRQVQIHQEEGRQVIVEIVRDAQGNPISQTRIVIQEEPMKETSIERVQPDPEKPGQFVHSYENTYSSGGQTVVSERQTSYEGQPDVMPPPDQGASFGPAYHNQSFQAQRSDRSMESVVRDGFVSQESNESNYDPETKRETQTNRRVTFEETTLDAAALPAGADRSFDPKGPIVQGTVYESVTLPNGQSVTAESQVTAQDNVRVTTQRSDGGPQTVTIERQTGDNTKLTQVLVEGSTQSVITQTSAQGNTVEEHSRMLNQEAGAGQPTLVGASDTTKVYGADGQVSDLTRTTVGNGERTTERTTRTVNGDEASYRSTILRQQGDGPVQTTQSSQVNRLDAQGNEVFVQSDVTLADGTQATISEADGQTRSVRIADPSGGPAQSGRVEPLSGGGSRVVFTDVSGKPQELTFTADGQLADGSSLDSLSPEQRAMLPLLMLGEHGLTANGDPGTTGTLQDTLHSGGVSSAEHADVINALVMQEASTTELAQHGEPRSPIMDTLLQLQGKAGKLGMINTGTMQLGGERLGQLLPMLTKVGGALNLFGGGVNLLSGADRILNPEDYYSRYEGTLDLLGGGTSVFGGAAALGLISATPPGWLLGAIGGATMLGKMLIDHRRDHSYAGMMSELIPGGAAMDPALWESYQPVSAP